MNLIKLLVYHLHCVLYVTFFNLSQESLAVLGYLSEILLGNLHKIGVWKRLFGLQWTSVQESSEIFRKWTNIFVKMAVISKFIG